MLVTDEGTPADAADLLRWIGTIHRMRGDLDHATELYEASLATAEGAALTVHIASALNCLAIVSQFRADVDAAEVLYARAATLAGEAGDDRLAAMIDQNLGTLSNTMGDVDAAIASYRSALDRFSRLGDDVGSMWTLNNLGMACVDRRDWDGAERYFDEAFDYADRLRDMELLATIELNRAELCLGRTRYDLARDSCDRAFEIFSRVGAKQGIGEAYKFYGILYREMDRPSLAEAHFLKAVELAESCEDRLLEAESRSEWAELHLGRGDNTNALRCLSQAHRLFATLRAGAEMVEMDRRLDRLEEMYMRVVREWGESIESKDRYTAGHCQRVADYACILAREVGFAGRDLTWFRMGGFLHDVGKMAVPEDVLNKPAKLTEEEWKVMQSHTTVGDDIVSQLDFPWDIRPIVRNHHERWDGTGYPDRLAGEDIPLTARILCVADVYDALTTARSYRPALKAAEAFRIMERDSGRIFDPKLFEMFYSLMRGRGGAAGTAQAA
jgi:putative nucleotidyltransferase with HDIG domain